MGSLARLFTSLPSLELQAWQILRQDVPKGFEKFFPKNKGGRPAAKQAAKGNTVKPLV